MSRFEEIIAVIPDEYKSLLTPTVKNTVNLEEKLEYFMTLPPIEIHPTNPMKQRNTPAAKLYKEYLQQYVNCMKLIESVIYRDKRLEGEEVEDSPLRKWFNDHVN